MQWKNAKKYSDVSATLYGCEDTSMGQDNEIKLRKYILLEKNILDLMMPLHFSLFLNQ
jgi:hypothetical protein